MLMVSCLWIDSRWRSISLWAFLPVRFSHFSGLVKWKDLTLICWSVLFPWFFMDSLRHLKVIGLSHLWGELSQVQAATHHAPGSLCQTPLLPWPVRCCILLLTVNQTRSCQIMQGYTQPQKPDWDLQNHFHMQCRPRSFSQVCNDAEKEQDAKGQTHGIGDWNYTLSIQACSTCPLHCPS